MADEIAATWRLLAVAPAMTWMADANGAYDHDDSLRLGDALNKLGFRWLEEPLPTTGVVITFASAVRRRDGLGCVPGSGARSVTAFQEPRITVWPLAADRSAASTMATAARPSRPVTTGSRPSVIEPAKSST